MAIQHTQGEWVFTNGWNNAERHINCDDKTIVICRAFAANLSPDEAQANAALIVDAVNNTAGKGIDPNAVPGLLEIAKGLDEVMNAGMDIKAGLQLHRELKQAIKAAELK